MLRHVEQSLALVIEMTRDDQGPRIADAQALFRKLESAGDSQRRGGQHHGLDGVEQALLKQRCDIDRRSVKETASASPFSPIHMRRVGPIHEKGETPRHLLSASNE